MSVYSKKTSAELLQAIYWKFPGCRDPGCQVCKDQIELLKRLKEILKIKEDVHLTVEIVI